MSPVAYHCKSNVGAIWLTMEINDGLGSINFFTCCTVNNSQSAADYTYSSYP